MHIWVDADACPVVIKEIIFKAATRTATNTTLVANHFMRLPKSPYLNFVSVEKGFDVADNEIVRRLEPGDLVIASDIPLAAEAIEKGAAALSPRGELHTTENIKARLTMRNFMDELRSSGVDTGGPKALSQADRQTFANHLDKLLVTHKRP